MQGFDERSEVKLLAAAIPPEAGLKVKSLHMLIFSF